MATTEARQIAKRLGLSEAAILHLQRRGYLHELPLSDRELRERLARAHAAYLARAARDDNGGKTR